MAVESTKSNPTTASPDRASWPVGGPALVTLMVLQIIIGYEWLSSGITKIASGDFVSGLGADLTDQSGDAAGWYHSFLESTIIPNARTFAVLIEVGEVVVGIAFIGAALLWLARWSRLSESWRKATLVVTMLAALGGIFMALNFHLASGANHPWLIPKEGFDETIDVDTVLISFQLALFVFCGYIFLKARRVATDGRS